MKWGFSGCCDAIERCCYYHSPSEGRTFDTKEMAEAAADKEFPGANHPKSPFSWTVFEV